jgi:uncharacterized protein (TIGR00288 family)
MNTTNERRIALFLDFENLVTNTGFTAANFDLQPALTQLLERGKVIFRRAYCDWARFKEAKAGLHALGVELTDVPPSTNAGKNGADIRLVIDALELSYAREHIDTFAIMSGDSDFCPLAHKLRENDKRVIGIAVREATSPFFVRACDEFLYLTPASRTGARAASGRGGHSRRAEGGGSHERGGSRRGQGGQGKGVVPQLARDVVSALLTRATGPLNPSLIKETMVRQEPDFDERAHGFSSLSRMLEAMQAEGLLKLQQLRGRQWYVVPADQPEHPSPAGADTDSGLLEEEELIPDPED